MAEMFWTCSEERWWIHWTKDVEYGAAMQEEKKKITEEVLSWNLFVSHGIINSSKLRGS